VFRRPGLGREPQQIATPVGLKEPSSGGWRLTWEVTFVADGLVEAVHRRERPAGDISSGGGQARRSCSK